jgi:hypothetical protein
MKLLSLSLFVLLAGCSSKSSSSSEGTPAAAPAKPLDVAAVNALVPASLKDKVTFEKTEIVEERGRSKRIYTVAAPKGWTQGMKAFAKVKPPSEASLGFMTELTVGTDCNGACEPKDWAKTLEDMVKQQFGDAKLTKDVKGPNSRTIIADRGENVVVIVASWTEGAKEYNRCGGTFEGAAKELVAAVEKACEAVSYTEQ